LIVCAAEKNKTPFEDFKGFKWKWEKPKDVGYEGVGSDVRCNLNVEFEEAILGAEKEVEFQAKVFCEKCKGQGMLKGTTIRCTPCEGKGRALTSRKLKVKVPAGVQSGSTVRLKEQGDFGEPPGSLLVNVVAPWSTSTIRRDGADLYSDVKVTQKALDEGTTVTVVTVEGSEGSLKVPPNTKSGAHLRIKGRGAPTAIGNMEERGDHYFRLVVSE